MNKGREFPIAISEDNSYGDQRITIAVFAANQSLKKQLLNMLTLLRRNSGSLLGLGDSSGAFVCRSVCRKSPFPEKSFHFLKFFGQDFQESIPSTIDEDYSVFFNTDDSVIRKDNNSYSSILSKIGVICGYDKNEKTYGLLICDENRNRKRIKISQKCLKILKKEGIDSYTFSMFHAIRKKNATVKLNVREVYRALKQCLYEAGEKYLPFVSASEGCCANKISKIFLDLWDQLLKFGKKEGPLSAAFIIKTEGEL